MRVRLIVPLLFAGLLSLPTAGKAALIVNSVVTTSTAATILATWTDPDPGTVIQDQGTPFWDVDLTSISAGGGFGLEVTAGQHIVGPHPGDDPFGPPLLITFLGVSPGVGGGTRTVSGIHPSIPHVDTMSVTITPIGVATSSVALNLMHTSIPEPGSLGLGVLGAGLLFAFRLRSPRQSW